LSSKVTCYVTSAHVNLVQHELCIILTWIRRTANYCEETLLSTVLNYQPLKRLISAQTSLQF